MRHLKYDYDLIDVSPLFSDTATGYRLKRGYKTSASMENKPRDIDHLVFVVHGIGQKRDTGKIIRNTTW